MEQVIVIRHSNDPYEEYLGKHGPHFNEKLAKYASSQMINSDGTAHTWTADQIKDILNADNATIPDTSTLYDVTYTANMAYADFRPLFLDDKACIKYALAVANDKDGYEGIQFKRWVADIAGKGKSLKWEEFI